MRIPRIYHPEPLTSHSHIALCEDAANHIGRVLRMGPGQALQLFDGSNQVFDAEITSASKKSVEVKVLEGQQWQKIAIAACEQCGRNRVPEIRPAMDLEAWCAEQDEGLKLNLHPRASNSINTLPLPVERVRLLIGPEGGLSADEIAMTARYQFTDILLGPRVLRTETTALTAITALQVRFGDLG